MSKNSGSLHEMSRVVGLFSKTGFAQIPYGQCFQNTVPEQPVFVRPFPLHRILLPRENARKFQANIKNLHWHYTNMFALNDVKPFFSGLVQSAHLSDFYKDRA